MKGSKYDTKGDGTCGASACKNVLSSRTAGVDTRMLPIIQADAAKIGITFKVRSVNGAYPVINTPKNNIPISDRSSWGKDYGDPGTFFTELFERHDPPEGEHELLPRRAHAGDREGGECLRHHHRHPERRQADPALRHAARAISDRVLGQRGQVHHDAGCSVGPVLLDNNVFITGPEGHALAVRPVLGRHRVLAGGASAEPTADGEGRRDAAPPPPRLDPAMLLYIARRLVWTLVVIFCVLAITFLIFYKLPNGDPALRFAGKQPTPQLLAEIHHRLGLDRPWYIQFGKYAKNFFLGDQYGWPGLGYSFSGNVSVLGQVIQRAPRTLLLIAGAAIMWLITGVTIGVISAVKRRSVVDRLTMGFALFGISTPVFWLGLMMLFIFWRKLGWTSGSGYVPLDQGFSSWFSHLILPWSGSHSSTRRSTPG